VRGCGRAPGVGEGEVGWVRACRVEEVDGEESAVQGSRGGARGKEVDEAGCEAGGEWMIRVEWEVGDIHLWVGQRGLRRWWDERLHVWLLC
jgi:hypothetical protein